MGSGGRSHAEWYGAQSSIEPAELSLKASELTRRNTRVHFMQPLKERIVREVGYRLLLEGAAAADLDKSMQARSEPVA